MSLQRRTYSIRFSTWKVRRLNQATFRVIFLPRYMCAKINVRVALYVISVCSNDKLPWREVIWLAESSVGLSRVPDRYKCASRKFRNDVAYELRKNRRAEDLRQSSVTYFKWHFIGRLYVCQNKNTHRSLRYIGGAKTLINSLNIVTKVQQNRRYDLNNNVSYISRCSAWEWSLTIHNAVFSGLPVY